LILVRKFTIGVSWGAPMAQNEIVTGYTSGAAIIDLGTWGACTDCAALIDAKDWQGLIERVVVGTVALDPDLTPE